MKTHAKHVFFAIVCTALALSACTPKAKPKAAAKDEKPIARLTLLPHESIQPGRPTTVIAKLTHNKGLYALNDNDLENVHTSTFHLLVIDPTFSDYQHIHPRPTETPGLYSFQFTPKMAGGYRAWADITPKETGQQTYASADLGTPGGLKINKADTREASVGGYRFTLSFDNAPTSGSESMGKITVADMSGNPVKSLEPVMGTYGHIVGFYDDFRTVMHVHPMGDEPGSESDRGGPELSFHMEPTKPGFVKLFAQVKIGGKELFVPFGVNVVKD